MKLLYDANLSPKLVRRLDDLFPGSVHVFDTGLAAHTSDQSIWEYARRNGFVIVTADSDFLALAKNSGAPPKVIRIANCNFRTLQVEAVLRRHAVRIAQLEHSSQSILIIRSGG